MSEAELALVKIADENSAAMGLLLNRSRRLTPDFGFAAIILLN